MDIAVLLSHRRDVNSVNKGFAMELVAVTLFIYRQKVGMGTDMMGIF